MNLEQIKYKQKIIEQIQNFRNGFPGRVIPSKKTVHELTVFDI